MPFHGKNWKVVGNSFFITHLPPCCAMPNSGKGAVLIVSAQDMRNPIQMLSSGKGVVLTSNAQWLFFIRVKVKFVFIVKKQKVQ